MGLRERKRAATAASIESCALELFEAKGYAATTVDDIAEAANVSRATIFRYFPSKDDILLASFTEAGDALREICRSSRGRSSYPAAVARVMTEFTTDLLMGDDMALRVQIIGSDVRLLARGLLYQAEWAEIIASELSEEPPTVAERAIAGAAMAAANAAAAAWAADASGDFDAVLGQAFAAIGLPTG